MTRHIDEVHAEEASVSMGEKSTWTAPSFVEALPSTDLPSRRQLRPLPVGLLELQRGHVPAPRVEPAVIIPIEPFGGR